MSAMLSRYAHLSPAHLWKAVEGLAQQQTGSETGQVYLLQGVTTTPVDAPELKISSDCFDCK